MIANKRVDVSGLTVRYGHVVAVEDVSFELEAGAAISILGTNGAGKTSTVEALAGLLPKAQGSVQFNGLDITNLSASTVARLGMALAPQARELFPSFTVEDTLIAARRAANGRGPRSEEEIYQFFPLLAERRKSLAGNLSGGEQQMLTIGRALVSQPTLLILDELSAGLAQGIVWNVIEALQSIRSTGIMLIVVEQNLEIAAALTERCLVLSAGREVWRGAVQIVINDESVRNKFFH